MKRIASGHPCPVEGCEQNVRREYLMCPFHWARVSRLTQRKAYAACRAWIDQGAPAEPAFLEAAVLAVKEASA